MKDYPELIRNLIADLTKEADFWKSKMEQTEDQKIKYYYHGKEDTVQSCIRRINYYLGGD